MPLSTALIAPGAAALVSGTIALLNSVADTVMQPDPIVHTEAVIVIVASSCAIVGSIVGGFLFLHRILNRIEGLSQTTSKELTHNGGSTTKDLVKRAADDASHALTEAELASRSAARAEDGVAALAEQLRDLATELRNRSKLAVALAKTHDDLHASGVIPPDGPFDPDGDDIADLR